MLAPSLVRTGLALAAAKAKTTAGIASPVLAAYRRPDGVGGLISAAPRLSIDQEICP
jgi:hypothetical protein